MYSQRKKKHRRKRNCRHCKELYLPDIRNRHHQRYCSKPECRKASKKASQQRWASSEKGWDYFKNPDNTLRVKQWREAHPGYWKREGRKTKNALQDVLPSQLQSNHSDTTKLAADTLQDVYYSQLSLLIGLIASLTGNALQDNIAETSRRFINLGQDILGMNPVSKSEWRNPKC